MITTIIESIKSLMEFIKDPIKLIFIVSWVFFFICVTYLYDKNIAQETKLAEYEANCQKSINIARDNCEEQLKNNREKSQAQINSFIEKSNMERDSIYRYFYKTIKTYNVKINKNIQELNELKHESNS